MNGLPEKEPDGQDSKQRQDEKLRVHPHRPKRLFHTALIALLCTFIFSRETDGQKSDSTLAIIDAGVQSSEDAPFVSPSYRFLPGDFLYATFQISNFISKRTGTEGLPKISIQYEARLEDQAGVPMAPPETGSIDSELSAEDKNWTPKKRVSFTVPPFIGSGKAQVHIVVKDLIGASEASRSLPLAIGGVTILSERSLAVQNLQFFRKENDTDALEVAAYSPGDSVFGRLNITGFKTGDQNTYHVVYDVLVQRPDGKPYIEQPHAAELSAGGFYPAQYLPAVLQFTTTANSAKGTYPVTLTIHDLVAGVTTQAKTAFTLE